VQRQDIPSLFDQTGRLDTISTCSTTGDASTIADISACLFRVVATNVGAFSTTHIPGTRAAIHSGQIGAGTRRCGCKGEGACTSAISTLQEGRAGRGGK